MKKTIAILAIITLFLIDYTPSWACPPPSLPFRVLTMEADLIIGIQLNQVNPSKNHYPIHQVLKGDYPDNFISSKTTRGLDRQDEKNVYTLVFLQKDDEGKYYRVWADNSVLKFKTMDDAEYSIKRFKEIISILDIKNEDTRDSRTLDWFTKSIEVADQTSSFLPWRIQTITKSSWQYDALWDLDDWEAKAVIPGKGGFRYPAWRTGALDLTSESQKERIVKKFMESPTPSRNFLNLVTKLGVQNIEDKLFAVLYQALEMNDPALINPYERALTKLDLPESQQQYLSKLILYNAKANIIPYLSENAYGYRYDSKNITYIANYLSSQKLQVLADDWIIQLDEMDFEEYFDIPLFSQFSNEAEQHLNMCADKRISQLTGKRKLWECADESAFAEVESFEEGSIETTVFPNPNNGNFKLSVKLEKGNVVHLELMDLAGQSVSKSVIESENSDISHYYFQESIQLEGLKSGMYLLSIRQGNKITTEKVMIE